MGVVCASGGGMLAKNAIKDRFAVLSPNVFRAIEIHQLPKSLLCRLLQNKTQQMTLVMLTTGIRFPGVRNDRAVLDKLPPTCFLPRRARLGWWNARKKNAIKDRFAVSPNVFRAIENINLPKFS